MTINAACLIIIRMCIHTILFVSRDNGRAVVLLGGREINRDMWGRGGVNLCVKMSIVSPHSYSHICFHRLLLSDDNALH